MLNRLKQFLIANVGYVVTYLLGRSLRYHIIGAEPFDLYKGKQGFLISGWHSQQLICFYLFRNRGYHGLASNSRDGEYISQVMHKLGWHAIRGSSSKGAVRGLVELIQVLRKGDGAAITPDGPRGPLHHVEPGAIYACQKSGAALIPVAFVFSRCWTLRTWDKFVIPKPFARCVLYVGEPLWFPSKKFTDAELAIEIKKVEAAMQTVNQLAEAELH